MPDLFQILGEKISLSIKDQLGETIEKALSNVEDAFLGVLEIYVYTKRKLPESIVNYRRVSEPKFVTKTPQAEHYPDFCFQATMPPPPIETNLSYSEIF